MSKTHEACTNIHESLFEQYKVFHNLNNFKRNKPLHLIPIYDSD